MEPGAAANLSRPLVRLLRSYAARVEALRSAESDYHGGVLTESLRHKGKLKRASGRRINAAFSALAEAVVELQASQAAVLALAEDESIPPETVSALNDTFAFANREYADYLAARTYDQVQEVARQGPLQRP